jgi:site-specific DNA recombinase
MSAQSTIIYCRISADRAGRSEGVQAQERWGREYAAIHWPGIPVRIFSDNDLSAAKDDVIRPEFEKMREAIHRGECAHLWAVEQSRLTRIEGVWFSLAADLLKTGVDELHTRREGVTRMDDVVGGIKAVLDAAEVRKLRKRVIDKKDELARQGRPGGMLGFGYRQRIYTEDEQERLDAWEDARRGAMLSGDDIRRWREDNPRPEGGRKVTDEHGRAAVEIVPREAEIIRQCAAKMLSGWTLTSVTMWLRESGIRSSTGAQFRVTTVGRFLTLPSVAGFRVHKGEIVGKGTWEPILDEATWRALCATIGSAKRAKRRPQRRYLLGGHRMICECGKAMRGTSDPRWGLTHYVCWKIDGGCSKVTIDADAVDDHVFAELFAQLKNMEVAGMLAADDFADRRGELVSELQALGQRRTELSVMWSARKITTEQFSMMNASVVDDQRRIGADLADLPAPIEDVDPTLLKEAWPDMTLEERQKFIGDWIEKVKVSRATLAQPTISDVACKAGVAHATAWRVFQGNGSAAATPAVLAAAESLGYTYQAGRRARSSAFEPGRVEIAWRRHTRS